MTALIIAGSLTDKTSIVAALIDLREDALSIFMPKKVSAQKHRSDKAVCHMQGVLSRIVSILSDSANHLKKLRQ